jgi:hypothetical protein
VKSIGKCSKYVDPRGLKKALDAHKQKLSLLKEKLQKLLQLRAAGSHNLKPIVLEGEILRTKKAIIEQEAAMGSLKFEKQQRAGELLDKRLASKNDNRGAFTAAGPRFVQGGSPGSKK